MYSLPAGSTVTNGDTSDASDLNTPLADIEADLNVARPIVAGGTGATSAAAARTNLGLTQLAGRNLILNGTGRINQRAYVSGTATVGANQYTLDQWRVVTLGQNLTFTGGNAGRVMTAPAGGVEQVITGGNIVGGTYIINWTGTATCTVDGTPRAKGDTFTLTADTSATVRFISGTFTEVQLEAGSLATPYEWTPRPDEERRCLIHYQQMRIWSRWTAAGAGELDGRFFMFPAAMRAVPTVALTTVTTSTNVTPTVTPAILGLQFEAASVASGVVEYLVTYALSAEL